MDRVVAPNPHATPAHFVRCVPRKRPVHSGRSTRYHHQRRWYPRHTRCTSLPLMSTVVPLGRLCLDCRPGFGWPQTAFGAEDACWWPSSCSGLCAVANRDYDSMPTNRRCTRSLRLRYIIGHGICVSRLASQGKSGDWEIPIPTPPRLPRSFAGWVWYLN